MKKNIIEVKNLTKKFKNGDTELIAVNEVSFNITKGEFVSIIGKSGSGKSTLLYQLGLLDHPTSGSIIISGTDVLNLSPKGRTNFRLSRLGYVFQDYALMPTLNAADNIMVPLIMGGETILSAKEIATKALSQVGLGSKINNLPSQLSGGEQQRVSIARAVANNPEILFADEPTANLDTETSQIILDLLKSLNEGGQTIVMVTHEADYTKTAKKVIRLSDGKIVS